jgi:hypothetical protein
LPITGQRVAGSFPENVGLNSKAVKGKFREPAPNQIVRSDPAGSAFCAVFIANRDL